MEIRSFEDLRVDQVLTLGSHCFEAEEIIHFGRSFDPQPMHCDEEAAVRVGYPGLIASGWHTMAVLHRLTVEGIMPNVPRLGVGVEQLKWLEVVRPGDRVTARVVVLECRPSKGRPGYGLLKSRNELVREDGAVVVSLVGLGLYPLQNLHEKPNEEYPT